MNNILNAGDAAGAASAAGAAARSQRSQRSQSSNSKYYRQYGLVTIIARSLAVSEWRAPASVTSPVWKNPIHRNPFLIINQIHKYTQMTHTFFVTYECTKLLCVSLTRFYHDSFSFKENTYPVLNQRHISVDIRTAPFFTGANHARSRFSKLTLPQRAACCVLSQVTFLLSPPGKVFQVIQGSRGFCLIPRSTLLTD